MELLNLLLLTVFIAALFSFFTAKLVNAVADNNDAPTSTSTSTSSPKDSRLSMSSVVEQKGLKVEGFDSVQRVGAVDDDGVEKVNEFHSESGLSENLAEREILVVGLPEKSSEVSSGEVTKGFDCGEVVSVDKDCRYIVDREFSANNGEQNVEVKIETSIDDGVKDGEFNVNELNRDVIDDEVKDGEIDVINEGVGDEKGESKEVLSSDDDDSDWEGIEITETEKIFAEAVKFVVSKDNREIVSSVGSDMLMKLDALLKVVAEGPCLEPQPMALKVSARAKWNARQRLGNMNPDLAMEQYVALLSQKIPGWMEGTSENIKSGLAAGEIPSTSDSSLSTYPYHQPHSAVERQLEQVFGVKEGDLVETTDLDKEIK